MSNLRTRKRKTTYDEESFDYSTTTVKNFYFYKFEFFFSQSVEGLRAI